MLTLAKRNSQACDSAKRDFFSFFHVGYAVHGVQHWEYLNFDWENYIFVVLSITFGGHEAGLFYAYYGLFLIGFDLRCSLYSTNDLQYSSQILKHLYDFPLPQCWFGYYSRLTASKYAWLNIAEGEGQM